MLKATVLTLHKFLTNAVLAQDITKPNLTFNAKFLMLEVTLRRVRFVELLEITSHR
jgi:hypothetical protein